MAAVEHNHQLLRFDGLELGSELFSRDDGVSERIGVVALLRVYGQKILAAQWTAVDPLSMPRVEDKDNRVRGRARGQLVEGRKDVGSRRLCIRK